MRISWSALPGSRWPDILCFVCGSFMVSFCENVRLLFLRIPLCCGTPDDPAVAPVEAGHCEGGRGGGGGKGRRVRRERSEVYEDIRVNL